MVFAKWRYPITLLPEHSIIFGGVNLYLSPELYAKNKSFMRDFKENGEVKVTSDMLQYFRRQLNDQSYNVPKIYTFKSLFTYSKVIMKEDDFVLPDFNRHVKLKDQLSKELVKKILEFSHSVFGTDKKVKELATSNHDNLSGQAEYIKNLSKRINLKFLTHAYENFFCTI